MDVKIGGSEVLAIMDSGASASMITHEPFKVLIGRNARITNLYDSSSEEFQGYGVPNQQSQMEILAVFDALIEVQDETHNGKFDVSKRGNENLICKFHCN